MYCGLYKYCKRSEKGGRSAGCRSHTLTLSILKNLSFATPFTFCGWMFSTLLYYIILLEIYVSHWYRVFDVQFTTYYPPPFLPILKTVYVKKEKEKRTRGMYLAWSIPCLVSNCHQDSHRACMPHEHSKICSGSVFVFLDLYLDRLPQSKGPGTLALFLLYKRGPFGLRDIQRALAVRTYKDPFLATTDAFSGFSFIESRISSLHLQKQSPIHEQSLTQTRNNLSILVPHNSSKIALTFPLRHAFSPMSDWQGCTASSAWHPGLSNSLRISAGSRYSDVVAAGICNASEDIKVCLVVCWRTEFGPKPISTSSVVSSANLACKSSGDTLLIVIQTTTTKERATTENAASISRLVIGNATTGLDVAFQTI